MFALYCLYPCIFLGFAKWPLSRVSHPGSQGFPGANTSFVWGQWSEVSPLSSADKLASLNSFIVWKGTAGGVFCSFSVALPGLGTLGWLRTMWNPSVLCTSSPHLPRTEFISHDLPVNLKQAFHRYLTQNGENSEKVLFPPQVPASNLEFFIEILEIKNHWVVRKWGRGAGFSLFSPSKGHNHVWCKDDFLTWEADVRNQVSRRKD